VTFVVCFISLRDKDILGLPKLHFGKPIVNTQSCDEMKWLTGGFSCNDQTITISIRFNVIVVQCCGSLCQSFVGSSALQSVFSWSATSSLLLCLRRRLPHFSSYKPVVKVEAAQFVKTGACVEFKSFREVRYRIVFSPSENSVGGASRFSRLPNVLRFVAINSVYAKEQRRVAVLNF